MGPGSFEIAIVEDGLELGMSARSRSFTLLDGGVCRIDEEVMHGKRLLVVNEAQQAFFERKLRIRRSSHASWVRD